MSLIVQVNCHCAGAGRLAVAPAQTRIAAPPFREPHLHSGLSLREMCWAMASPRMALAKDVNAFVFTGDAPRCRRYVFQALWGCATTILASDCVMFRERRSTAEMLTLLCALCLPTSSLNTTTIVTKQ